MSRVCLAALAASVCMSAAACAQVKPPITAIAIAPTDGLVVIGSQAGIELRQGAGLAPVGQLATQLTNVHDLAFSPNGRWLLAAGGSPGELGILELYEWPSRELVRSDIAHEDVVYAVAWDAESRLFASASADQRVKLFRAETGALLHTLADHSQPVIAAEFLPDGDGLVTAGVDQSLRVWNVQTGAAIRALTNHTGAVNDLAVQPSTGGAMPMIASASEDRTVRFWQPTIGRMVRFIRLESRPLAVAWRPDGGALYAACEDGHVRAIDPGAVTQTADRLAMDGQAYAAAVAPDGRVLVGGVGGALIWVDFEITGGAPPR